VEAIPKRLVRDAVDRLASVTVEAPVSQGQTILPDILGTGVDVIACRDLPARGKQ
jgi:CxxC motif-containing protein